MPTRIFDLLRKESDFPLRKLLFIAGISGLANALLIVILNLAVADIAADSHSFPLLLQFVIVLAVTILTRKRAVELVTASVEESLHKIRLRIADKVRRSDLRPLEAIGRSSLYAAVQRDTLTISQAVKPLTVAIQTTALVVCSMLYIAVLSLPAFLMINGALILTVAIHFARRKEISEKLAELLRRQDTLFDSILHVVDGFKEVKLHGKRSDELYDYTQKRSEDASALKVEIENQFIRLSVFGLGAIYTCVALIVFLLPELSPDYQLVSVKVVTTFLFIVGPISSTVGAVSEVAGAEVAVATIYQIEERLGRPESLLLPADGEAPKSEVPKSEVPKSFESIRMEEVVFRFGDEKSERSFTVGPIDLQVSKGEVIFVTGGNGSGKSTLLKLLTGLYFPDSGRLLLDGKALEAEDYESYRNLFSAVFWDYHLFDRLYGMGDVEQERVRTLLEDLELQDKTDFADGELTNRDLSTGQKKRLALLVALLEDRPICIFDEWAADQDPVFRKYFYREMLPRLKAEGKTVIAVTHDDHYFDAADRILQMQVGRLGE